MAVESPPVFQSLDRCVRGVVTQSPSLVLGTPSQQLWRLTLENFKHEKSKVKNENNTEEGGCSSKMPVLEIKK